MSDDKRIEYSVIITLSLPADAGAASLRLLLGPADEVMASDGNMKMLQECTLADLQQFADALEGELWKDYLDSTLFDLVVDDQLQIEYVYEMSVDNPEPADGLLLEHAVIFPNNSEARDQDEREDTETFAVEESADEATDLAAIDEAPTDDVAQEEDGVGELTPEVTEEEASEEVAEPDPKVTVAETESVHEEREALPDAAAGVLELEQPVVRPRVRILGRRRPLGHGTPSAVDILINELAFRDTQAHAISSPDREVAGVLIGPPPEKQPDGRYVVHISDMIIAKHTRMQGASVTYTPESWRYINDRLAELYPDDTAVIVGWYHTHPGFGIFLSGMDRFIHHNFFTQIWHVALVLDPVARRSGFFSWNRSQSQVDAYDFPWPEWAAQSW